MRPGDPDPRAVREVVGRIFPGGERMGIERVLVGGSTFVYRLRRGSETFYLRILPESDASFLPEALAHEMVRARGVLAPEVLYVERLAATVDRSVMVTAEIPGAPLSDRPMDAGMRDVVIAAGRQLALINAAPVRGFGWIRRDRDDSGYLEAEHLTFQAWMLEHLDADVTALERAQLLDGRAAAQIRRLVERPGALDDGPAALAHGDFDVTHIFQVDGRYSGIIDFGEIRGADRWYDLGHFLMHDAEVVPGSLLPWLLEGYGSVTGLPADANERIAWASVLIGVRAWARSLGKSVDRAARHVARRTVPRELRRLRG